jgi:hypothetical protein
MRTSFATLLLSTVVLGLGSPVPAARADTSLGGYDATATASAVRVMVFEPSLPLPAEPQGDLSIGYTRSSTGTGPSARALASYLWPGDALGDGLGVLMSNEALDYPVKVSSKYPATPDAPAENTAQLTDGNGMTTSADGSATTSTVTGLGVTGTNLGSGIGTGLCELLTDSCPEAPETPAPVEVPEPLALAVTMGHVRSQSTVTLKDHGIASAAHTRASGISLLGGLITIDSLDVRAEAESNGTKAETSGTSAISGLEIAGQKVRLGDEVELGGTATDPPDLPLDALKDLGLTVEYLPTTNEVDHATGHLAAQGLTITVDIATLRDALRLTGAGDPLAPVLGQIPQLGPLLVGLAQLGSKIEIAVGDVSASAKANPAYVPPPPTDDGTDDETDQEDPSGGGSGHGSVAGTGGSVPDPGPAVPVSPDPGSIPVDTAPTTPVAATPLPGLDRVPSLLLLGALVLAGAIGWVFRTFGILLMGSPTCPMGLASGVPDLRKG